MRRFGLRRFDPAKHFCADELKEIKQTILPFQDDKHTNQIVSIIDVAVLEVDLKVFFDRFGQPTSSKTTDGWMAYCKSTKGLFEREWDCFFSVDFSRELLNTNTKKYTGFFPKHSEWFLSKWESDDTNPWHHAFVLWNRDQSMNERLLCAYQPFWWMSGAFSCRTRRSRATASGSW
jgi:hypothetical protein